MLVLQWNTQAGLHALGNIAGEPRPGDDMILDNNAEESLHRLIYGTASKTSKLTPSVSQLPLIFAV